MLTVLSPAKTLDFETPPRFGTYTEPLFVAEANQLVQIARRLSPQQLSNLMGINPQLAELNHARFKSWRPEFDLDNAKQSIFAFRGDVYRGLAAGELGEPELQFAQDHLAILSGLYGLLRPLDLMHPYRLEMGTKLANPYGESLYQFWADRVTDKIAELLQSHQHPVLINLASNEYFSVINPKRLAATVVTPTFKHWKNGRLKTITIYAKLARGSMARWIVDQRADTPDRLTGFNRDGYYYAPEYSEEHRPVFVREEL